MKLSCFIIFICYAAFCFSQGNAALEYRVLDLNRALIQKDSISLMELLQDDLEYRHSNAWVETKQELIRNNQSEALIYHSINEEQIHIKQKGKTSLVKYIADINGQLGEKNFALKLMVWQVWIKEKSKWKLWARQAVKIE